MRQLLEYLSKCTVLNGQRHHVVEHCYPYIPYGIWGSARMEGSSSKPSERYTTAVLKFHRM